MIDEYVSRSGAMSQRRKRGNSESTFHINPDTATGSHAAQRRDLHRTFLAVISDTMDRTDNKDQEQMERSAAGAQRATSPPRTDGREQEDGNDPEIPEHHNYHDVKCDGIQPFERRLVLLGQHNSKGFLREDLREEESELLSEISPKPKLQLQISAVFLPIYRPMASDEASGKIFEASPTYNLSKYCANGNCSTPIEPTDLVAWERMTTPFDKKLYFDVLNFEGVSKIPENNLGRDYQPFFAHIAEMRKPGSAQFACAAIVTANEEFILLPPEYRFHKGRKKEENGSHCEIIIIGQIQQHLSSLKHHVKAILIYTYNSPCLKNNSDPCMFQLHAKAIQWERDYGCSTNVIFTESYGLSGPDYLVNVIKDKKHKFSLFTSEKNIHFGLPFDLVRKNFAAQFSLRGLKKKLILEIRKELKEWDLALPDDTSARTAKGHFSRVKTHVEGKLGDIFKKHKLDPENQKEAKQVYFNKLRTMIEEKQKEYSARQNTAVYNKRVLEYYWYHNCQNSPLLLYIYKQCSTDSRQVCPSYLPASS